MIDNWNFSLSKASGDYLCFFTDKMMLLPDTLQNLVDVLSCEQHDIVSWIYDRYNPQSDDVFGPGLHISAKNFFLEGEKQSPGPYDPREALQIKASCHKPRNQFNSSEYARGKICFGAYSRRLVDKAIRLFGQLFHHYSSPDYTSMILASSSADSAYELAEAGVAHISSKISNGGKNTTNDQACLNAFKSLENGLSMLTELPVPKLYSSMHNCVLHDYTTLKEKFSLEYEVDMVKWLVHISEDLYLKDRVWSSHEVEKKQKEILRKFISSNLNSEEKARYERLCAINAINRPKFRKKKHEPVHCDTIYSILNRSSFT